MLPYLVLFAIIETRAKLSPRRLPTFAPAMRFKGPHEFEEFWNLLETESPRGLGIVVAAYFDEKLGSLLGTSSGDFCTRINLAFVAGIVTENERADLHAIRNLRNSFAHNLRANTFDDAKSRQVDSMKTWQLIVAAFPDCAELLPTAKERLLYVAATFYMRLKDRQTQTRPLPEPSIYDGNSWPNITDR